MGTTLRSLAISLRINYYTLRGIAIFFDVPLIHTSKGVRVSQQDEQFLATYVKSSKLKPDFRAIGSHDRRRRQKKSTFAKMAQILARR